MSDRAEVDELYDRISVTLEACSAVLARVRELGYGPPASLDRPRLTVIPGTARRRTKRRGHLRLVERAS